jgi:HK97 gp10 family phage protein
MQEVQIKGLRELDQKLRKLPLIVQTKVLNTALAAGSRLIVKEAKARVPVVTGRVLKNITHGKKKNPKGATREVGVNIRRTDKQAPFYWHFVEFGTVKHPARPFLRPAFESKKREAVDLIKKKIAQRIEIEAKKL